MPILCYGLCHFQPSYHQIHVCLGGRSPLFALLLETVENKHCLRKLDGVNRPIGATLVTLYHLQDPSAAKTFQHLGCVVPITCLGQRQRKAKETSDLHGHSQQVFVAATNPLERLFANSHEKYT